MLDPFGVFKSSGLVTTDADDDLVIKTTADLAQVCETLNPEFLTQTVFVVQPYTPDPKPSTPLPKT